MAGIYIHIPFCKTRCIYCDFYSNISMQLKGDFVQALLQEIAAKADYLANEEIQTLYFGGGTPSQLSADDWKAIFRQLDQTFDLSKLQEITLEANPDDLTEEYIHLLRSLPFNRISMGIQSFHDHDLQFLNRRHNASKAIEAVKACQAAGFDNISIDLIYGLPNQTMDLWKQNLEQAIALNVQHISSYHLIYEEKTKLYHLWQKGKVAPLDDELSLEMFQLLIHELKEAGFQHYEISNFAQPGYVSKHNSSYWKGIKYLGLGPSAHSFDGTNRQYNRANIKQYIENPLEQEVEILTTDEQYNDLVLTALRTHWGLDLNQVESLFGKERLTYCLEMAQPHLDHGDLYQKGNRLYISEAGIFISDSIMSDLMYI